MAEPQSPDQPASSDAEGRQPDPAFFARADAHIVLSNEQLDTADRGAVNASTMFALARFNAWSAACDFAAKQPMAERRDATIDYFVGQFRIMLEEHYDDYVENFDRYMARPEGTG